MGLRPPAPIFSEPAWENAAAPGQAPSRARSLQPEGLARPLKELGHPLEGLGHPLEGFARPFSCPSRAGLQESRPSSCCSKPFCPGLAPPRHSFLFKSLFTFFSCKALIKKDHSRTFSRSSEQPQPHPSSSSRGFHFGGCSEEARSSSAGCFRFAELPRAKRLPAGNNVKKKKSQKTTLKAGSRSNQRLLLFFFFCPGKPKEAECCLNLLQPLWLLGGR